MRAFDNTLLVMLAAVLFATAGCESDTDPGTPPFSEECDTCLSRGACEEAFASCSDDDDCQEHVRCVLRAECYTEDPGSNCSERAGCVLDEGAEEARSLAADFETCARTECADVCGFVEP